MFKRSFLLLFIVSGFVACGSSDSDNGGGTTDPVQQFDRGALLTNIADNLIIPALEDFSSKMNALESAGNEFATVPNTANLSNLRTAWHSAYKTWQYVEMFNIGRAEEIGYLNYMNIYPLSVTDVENNMANGGYDLDNVNYQDAQGFPALDYLLFGVANDDAAIVAKFDTDNNAVGYKTYLTDVLAKMKSVTDLVLTDWNNGYRDQFVSSTGNTSTSALNKLINDYVYYYEKGLRANKVGIPAGVFSATTLPEKVEAVYRDNLSKEFSMEALKAAMNVFNGRHYSGSGSGTGLSDYLNFLDRSDITSSINAQFNAANSQLGNLNDSFYQQIMTDNTQMTMAYDELQKAVILLKVDMMQAFNISVDYTDADGD